MSNNALDFITEDTKPARKILEQLNELGYATFDSQPGIIDKKTILSRAPKSIWLYAKSITAAYTSRAKPKKTAEQVYEESGGTWFSKSCPEPQGKQRAYTFTHSKWDTLSFPM